MKTTAVRTITAAAATVALMVTGLPVAAASPSPEGVEATAALIERVAPDQGRVVIPTQTNAQASATIGDTEIVVPLDPAAPITLDGTTDSAVAAVPALEITLPAEATSTLGQVASDGTVVFAATDGGASAAVQLLGDGSARLQTVTPDAAGPHEFTYTFGDGITPVLDEAGSVELVQDLGNGVAMGVGTIEKPWASDASGEAVATKYRVEGDALVQVLEPGEAPRYPIVADPKVTKTWWNTTVYFSRGETNTIAFVAGGIGSVAVKIPEPTISKAVAAAAGLSVAYVGWMYNNGSCLKFVYYGHIANVWQPYGGSEAGGYCR